MKRIMLLSAVVFSGVNAFAQTKEIVCEFTDPNFALIYQVELGVMSWQGFNKDGKKTKKVMGNQLSMVDQTTDPLMPMFSIEVPLANRTLELVYDFKGSDFQTPWVYPITAKWGASGSKNQIKGGCYTDQIDVVDIEINEGGEIEEF